MVVLLLLYYKKIGSAIWSGFINDSNLDPPPKKKYIYIYIHMMASLIMVIILISNYESWEKVFLWRGMYTPLHCAVDTVWTSTLHTQCLVCTRTLHI